MGVMGLFSRIGLQSDGNNITAFRGSIWANNLICAPNKVYYVDPTSGSTNYTGLSPKKAKATLKQAYDLCTSGAGDVIVLISRGTTSAGCTSYLTASLDWTKWGITVIGWCAPTRMAQRSRIANATASLDLAYLIDVQGSNNAFYNLSLVNGGSDAAALGCLKVTGDRNYFSNVHAAGAVHATPGVLIGSHDLLLAGDENTFENCTFGTDTLTKTGDVANANILLDGAGTNGARNRFIGCETLVQVTTTNTAHGAVKGVGGDCITRSLMFDRCIFHAYREGVVAVCASWFIGTAPNNGLIIVKDCAIIGYAAWDAATGNDRVYVCSGPAQAANGGLAIVAS